MSEKYKFFDDQGMYFVTVTTVGWVDLFTRWELKHVIIDSLRYCQKEKRLVIHAWCLMPSHLHMIISSRGEKLSNILRDFKKFTSKELIKTIEQINESRKDWILQLFSEVADGLNRVRNYKVWQDGNHPELLFKAKLTSRNWTIFTTIQLQTKLWMNLKNTVTVRHGFIIQSGKDIWKWRLSRNVEWHALQTRAN